MMKKSWVSLIALLGATAVHATVLVSEHFATSVNTAATNSWTAIAKYVDNTTIGVASVLQTGGLSYENGATVTGIDGLKASARDGYLYNGQNVANRFTKSLNSTINFSEGSTLYFSAIIGGAARANFGLGNVTETNFPTTLVSMGIQPQNSTTEIGYPNMFSSSVWTGDSSQADDGNGIAIGNNKWENRYLLIGKIVNNAGGLDEISYHLINLTNSAVSVDVPDTWSDTALSGAQYYSRTDYDFGGDLVFSNLVVDLQNHTSLDEIYFGTEYADVIPEPVTIGLLGMAAGSLLVYKRVRFHL
ncbi:MAG: hypothetical protein AB7E95_04050 [Kiritimatiellales bacterium]